MRIAVIADVHANLAALEAVLAEADGAGCGAVWFLGDAVGRGPQPQEVAARLREVVSLGVVGNHDACALGTEDAARLGPDHGALAVWSGGRLGAEERLWLSSLPVERSQGPALLIHAGLRWPLWEMVSGRAEAELTLRGAHARLVLAGHTHVPVALEADPGGGASRWLARVRPGTVVELGRAALFLNPGTVGNARGRDGRARWLLLDLDAGRAEFRATAYDRPATLAAIRARGLPGWLLMMHAG